MIGHTLNILCQILYATVEIYIVANERILEKIIKPSGYNACLHCVPLAQWADRDPCLLLGIKMRQDYLRILQLKEMLELLQYKKV